MPNKKVGRPRNPLLLEQFTMRLTPPAKRRLKALAELSGMPSYTLLEQSFWHFLANQPVEKRQAVETIAKAVESEREPGERSRAKAGGKK